MFELRPDEYGNIKSDWKFPADAQKRSQDHGWSVQIRQHLWHSARRNFYYADDAALAAALCDRLIARFPLSEEADEARLLLHDIGIECRKLAGDRAGACLYCPQDVIAEVRKCYSCRDFLNSRTKEVCRAGAVGFDSDWDQTTRVSIAIAVMALPIIGVAKGGIIGIGLPEIIGLLLLKSVFRGASKWGTSLRGQDNTDNHHPQNQKA